LAVERGAAEVRESYRSVELAAFVVVALPARVPGGDHAVGDQVIACRPASCWAVRSPAP
jgi:hypothetical protein